MAVMKIIPPKNALAFLKADLGFFGSKLDPDFENYLQGLIVTAGERIRKKGIVLIPGNADDDQFKASYAAWLYRNKNGQAMPESLAAEIRNRQVHNVTAGN
jgi:hypothetical protein